MESNGERIGRAFLDHAAVHLEQDLMPKVRSCVELLKEKDVWWREAEVENSVGNLVLHLAGNVRQWIISGMGGAPDVRERPKEFSDRGSVTKDEALTRLERTVSEAAAVLRSLNPEELLKDRVIQGFQRTGLQAVFHVVEHFGYHTGQFVFVTKHRSKTDLKFYNL